MAGDGDSWHLKCEWLYSGWPSKDEVYEWEANGLQQFIRRWRRGSYHGVCIKMGGFIVWSTGQPVESRHWFVGTEGGLLVLVNNRIKAPENGWFRAWRPCLQHRLFRQLRCILRCRYRAPELATTSLSPVPSPHITVCSRLALNVCYPRASWLQLSH